MHGPNGKHITNNMTWKEYVEWQRWDEWPEKSDNPPLTVETSFWYNGQEYMVTSINGVYAIVKQPDFEIVISNSYLKNKKLLDATNIKRSLRIRIPSKQVSSLYYNTDMVSRYYGVERWSIME
jgi:hypothetical protein